MPMTSTMIHAPRCWWPLLPAASCSAECGWLPPLRRTSAGGPAAAWSSTGWCAALVNVNDLSGMGAEPVGLLDAVGAPTRSLLTRVLRGLARASAAWGVPVLGGHTQLGVPAALSVTALGRTERPIPGGGGKPGHAGRLTPHLGGGRRPGYPGPPWDATTHPPDAGLRPMIGARAAPRPARARDV